MTLDEVLVDIRLDEESCKKYVDCVLEKLIAQGVAPDDLRDAVTSYVFENMQRDMAVKKDWRGTDHLNHYYLLVTFNYSEGE